MHHSYSNLSPMLTLLHQLAKCITLIPKLVSRARFYTNTGKNKLLFQGKLKKLMKHYIFPEKANFPQKRFLPRNNYFLPEKISGQKQDDFPSKYFFNPKKNIFPCVFSE